MGLDLPPYVTQRRRKNGTQRFYFQVPEHMRPDNWPAYQRLSDDVGEMFRQADDLNKRMAAERGGSPLVAHPQGSLPWLLSEYHKSPAYRNLSPRVQQLYDYCAEPVVAWSKEKGHPHVKLIRRPNVFKFLQRFDATPTKAKKIYGFLRILLGFACDMGEIDTNPALRMKLAEPAPAVHIWTEAEVKVFVTQADAAGLPQVGTAILLASEIGQRQGDVLDMEYGRDYAAGLFRFRQSKTGEIMEIKATARLLARLGADAPAQGLIVPTASGKRFLRANFTKLFNRVRKTVNLPHCQFLHLRHTAVVRMARAGSTVPEIAGVTGHTMASVHSILRRYLPRDAETAGHAIDKINASRVTIPAEKT